MGRRSSHPVLHWSLTGGQFESPSERYNAMFKSYNVPLENLIGTVYSILILEESCVREDEAICQKEEYGLMSGNDGAHRHRDLIAQARVQLSDAYVEMLSKNLSYMSNYHVESSGDGTYVRVQFFNQSDAAWAKRLRCRVWMVPAIGEHVGKCPGCRYHTENCGIPCTVSLV